MYVVLHYSSIYFHLYLSIQNPPHRPPPTGLSLRHAGPKAVHEDLPGGHGRLRAHGAGRAHQDQERTGETGGSLRAGRGGVPRGCPVCVGGGCFSRFLLTAGPRPHQYREIEMRRAWECLSHLSCSPLRGHSPLVSRLLDLCFSLPVFALRIVCTYHTYTPHCLQSPVNHSTSGETPAALFFKNKQ